jgi:diacylglycerol kinase family enzyme
MLLADGRMAARVAVVVNRTARHLREEGPLLRAILAGARGFDVYETRTLGDLASACASLRAAGAETVILAGGDGSYSAGVTALARAFADAPLPCIALAPGGTVSTVPRNWGMRGPAVPYAKRVLAAARERSGRITERRSLRVSDDRGGDRIGFIFGAGLVARFFEVYDAAPTQGSLAAAKIVAPIFVGSFFGGKLAKRVLTPVPCRIEVEGETHRGTAYSLVVASVVRDVGLHIRVTYRAEDEEERFHLVASSLGPLALGPQMPLVLAGQRLRGRDHLDVLARDARFVFGDEDAYVLDGDRIPAREVRLSMGPRLRLLTP